MEKLKCRVGINRRQQKNATQDIFIQVDDEVSGLRMIEVRMTPEDFALAVTGQYSKGEAEFNNSGLVGSTHENKTVEILVPQKLRHSNLKDPAVKKSLEALLDPFEVDGWKGDIRDITNMHNHTADGARVTFHRYLKSE